MTERPNDPNRNRSKTAAVPSVGMRGLLSRIKHPFCGVSHWLGVLLAIAGTVVLTLMSIGKPKHLVAFAIYGSALILLYVASSLYHTIRAEGKEERLLRNFDHAGIFLLISGTYVPVCLLALSPRLGWTFLILQAVCAAIGIAGTFLLKKFPEALNVVLYLVMGWMTVPALGYMLGHWPGYATAWLVAGGLTYTIGAIIFSLDKPHLVPGRFSAHDLWHLFVLGGSACHFFLMFTYVARLA